MGARLHRRIDLGCLLGGRRHQVQELARRRDCVGASAAGEQPVVADAVEALGQDMDEGTADELADVECHRRERLGIRDAHGRRRTAVGQPRAPPQASPASTAGTAWRGHAPRQEVWLARDPPAAIRGKPAARHDHVHVQMMRHRRGVQRRGDANAGARCLAALHGIVSDEGRLHRMQLVDVPKAFNRCHLAVTDIDGKSVPSDR
jgi:hypothetical protein